MNRLLCTVLQVLDSYTVHYIVFYVQWLGFLFWTNLEDLMTSGMRMMMKLIMTEMKTMMTTTTMKLMMMTTLSDAYTV